MSAVSLTGSCAATSASGSSATVLRWPRVPVFKLNRGTPSDAAAIYRVLGFAPLPLPRKSKKATGDWPDHLDAGGYEPCMFSDGGNLGLALGPRSRELVDVDIDSDDPLVARLADEFLRASVTFGREGRKRSHRLYRAPGSAGRVQLFLEGPRTTNPTTEKGRRKPKRQGIEIRGAGHYTVVPPGTHESDQRIRYDEGLADLADIAADELRAGVGRVAAAWILVQAWPDHGARHDFRLALCGALLNSGWSEEQARDFLRIVGEAAGDDLADLLAAVGTSAKRADRTGWPTVASLLQSYTTELGTTDGEQAVKLIREALFPRQTANAATSPISGAPPYVARDGIGMFHVRQTKDGPVEVQLSDFTARIVGDVGRDDGVEVKRVFKIEARCGGKPRQFDVPAERFGALGWVIENLGTAGSALAGAPTKDHLRTAILQLSKGQAVVRTEYTHTGWREIDGEWVYLHGGGAIGKAGPIEGLSVSLPPQLASFEFPPTIVASDLRATVRETWALAGVFRDHHVPLLLQAAVFRSVLPMVCNFSVFVVGPTGVFKSQLAAIAQQHFGEGFNDKNLPGSWSSTANATEVLAFAAKDAVLVVDDFAPGNGSTVDVNRYHQQAERLIRAQGNRAGRSRLTADATIKATKAPRGLIVATGEDLPHGQSIRARLLVLQMVPGMVASDALSRAQEAASLGTYARALGGFVAWIAAHHEAVRGGAQRQTVKYRGEAFAQLGSHRRTPEIAAQLMVASEMFAEFALAVGAITTEDAQHRDALIRRAIAEVGDEQAAHQAAMEPTTQFLDGLRTAIALGDAHIADLAGGPPRYEARAFGYRTMGEGMVVPNGKCVGWVSLGAEGSDGDLFLEPGASYAVAQEIARRHGRSLGIEVRTLHKRLDEKGLLVATEEEKRGTLTVRKVIQGHRKAVLHLPLGALIELADDSPL